MNRFHYILYILLLLGILPGCDKQASDVIYDSAYRDEINRARKDFAAFLGRNHISGGNIAIAKENRIIYSEGMGLASKDLMVPMSRTNKLRIGEVSQVFTSIIYLKLADEGKLVPDSTVQYYLNTYPDTDERLEIRHLPYHATGIRREEQGEDEIYQVNPSIEKGLEVFMHEPSSYPVGWFDDYSMFNINLLGALMEKATKKSFQQLLKAYVSDTLQLTHTVVDNPVLPIEGRAGFYQYDMLGRVVNAPFQDLRSIAPSNGILSNAEDLVKLGMAILESDYFQGEHSKKIFESCDLYGNKKSSMAHGWSLMKDPKDRDVNACSGSIIGGGAAVVIYPEEKLVIALATNMSLGNGNIPVFEIADYFLEEPREDP